MKKKYIVYVLLFLIAFYFGNKLSYLYSHINAKTALDKINGLSMYLGYIFRGPLISLHNKDLLVGLLVPTLGALALYTHSLDKKKLRIGEEYGSARWGTHKDIEPFLDDEPDNNILLTATESLTISNRAKIPKYSRNNNIICIGGSGSGKTRTFVKPNLMQMHSSYVVTDPKGTIINETGKMLVDNGYKLKVFNTINFNKSMHYNPFHYIKGDKDILKLANVIIANTKGEGEKSGEDFWVKAERLLYTAYIAYIHYEIREEDQNFNSLIKMINASETREDDEEFKNAIDFMFMDLEKKDPEHFAVRQYKKYKLAARVATSI